jgi:alkanesulfonate monooxygenase SsuD/methylene tetrahydromethanopterin reductase-like flavin-dependent oxidoreductase (luciferase family)
MRISLMIEGQEGVTWSEWLAIAQAAEEAGLEGLFRSDHYRAIVQPAPAGALDAWATLAGLAARTTRIRLGTLVSPVTFRPAAVLAKNVVTVDHISGGRVELGIGAGWYEAEHRSHGFPFGTARTRLDELDRQLAEITRQWTQADDVWPRPHQRPRPPIIVGGRARPRTLAAAVRHADEYNLVLPTLDEAKEGARRIRVAARGAGRQPLTVSMMLACIVGHDAREVERRLGRWRTISEHPDEPPLHGTVEEVARALAAYREIGIERAMIQHLDHRDLEMVALLGDVAAAVAAPGTQRQQA